MQRAEPVAIHARPLLAASHATLLSLTITTRTDRAVPLTMCWVGSDTPVPLRVTLTPSGAGSDLSLAAFELAGWQLLQELMVRWPPNAVPSAIGIVTDGDGVVFSPDHPSPLSPDWLLRHRSEPCVPSPLLAFSRDGAWQRLIAPRTATILH